MTPDDPVVHEILHSLTRIEARNGLADERNANADTRMEKIEETVDRLDDSIRGNGTPGLRERVVKVESSIGILRWLAGVVGTVFAAGLGWMLFG